MAQKTDRSSPGSPSGIGIDYALIVMAAGAALLALVYLILI
jgi:hypothetical protein